MAASAVPFVPTAAARDARGRFLQASVLYSACISTLPTFPVATPSATPRCAASPSRSAPPSTPRRPVIAAAIAPPVAAFAAAPAARPDALYFSSNLQA